MSKNYSNVKKFSRGQGLLEALVAIGIILIGLGAILTFTLKNIAAAADSAQRVVAANLAREAIDVVRGIRDSNWLAASNSVPARLWDDGLTAGTNEGAAVIFYLPVAPSTPTEWQVAFRDSRNVDSNYYIMYRHPQDYDWQQFPDGVVSSYINTGYNRLLLLDPICDSGGIISVAYKLAACPVGTKIGIKAEAQVSWAASGFFGGNQRRKLGIIEYIYNWR